MSLVDNIKDIALEELKAKGYAPNPADVSGIATRVEMLLKHEVEKALAEAKTADAKASTFSEPVAEPVQQSVAESVAETEPPV